MATTIVRPTFYEGEILPAADLTASVDAARGQMARHDRYVHRWGIVSGLELVGTDATTGSQAYKTVALKSGIAIDGTGREIVVPADTPLVPSEFQSIINPKPGIWYPVFLTGQDQPAPPSSNLTGTCNSSLPTKIQENAAIDYGSPGAEINLDLQTAPVITDGPADGTSSDPWRVLLGFVSWSTGGLVQFADVKDTSPDSNIGRRYVGVTAAAVVSEGGAVRLATHPTDFTGQTAVMALEVHEDNSGELVFGKQNPDGTITKVLTISSKGDITADGKVTGAVTPGSMQVQSGIAADGMTLPLPIGIDLASVKAGKVTLFIQVTPRIDPLQAPTSGGPYLQLPYECYVDDAYQVHSRAQWWNGTAAVSALPLFPALCDYTVIASVAASGSGS
jgi:hypothetical protein